MRISIGYVAATRKGHAHLFRPESQTSAGRVERQTHFLELLLNNQQTYHNQKETMAHAGILLQIGLGVGIASLSSWPPTWLPASAFSRWTCGTVFVILWLVTHIFVRWQLRNRRSAAIMYAALLLTLRKWADEPPPAGDLEPWSTGSGAEKPKRRAAFWDYLLPIPQATLHDDVDETGYVTGLVKEWRCQRRAGTGSISAEWIFWSAGFLMLIMGLYRTIRGM